MYWNRLLRRLSGVILAVLLLGMTAQVAWAASATAASYTFSTSTTASLVPMTSGTTTLVAADQDDLGSALTNIGFEFYFMGTRYSQFSANSNGLIQLGAQVQNASPYKPLAQTGKALIAPYGADQRTHIGDGKVHFKVIGSAPNRVLVVEFLNMQADFNTGGTAGLTYQAQLSETTGVITFVYGSMTMSTAGAADANSKDPHIGFSTGTTAGLIGTVTAPQSGTPAPSFSGSAATAVANTYPAGPIPVLTSAADGARRSFTFTPPSAPAAPTNLTFSNISPVAITLNWVDAPAETSYAIYNSTDGTNFSFVGSTAFDVVTFNATGLAANTSYTWRVYAASEGTLSSALEAVQATIPYNNVSAVGAGGLWSAPATWSSGAVPTTNDIVTIPGGATVTIDTAATANSVIVNASGILQFEALNSRSLTLVQNVTIASGGALQSAATGTVATHLLSLGGNLVNDGVLDLSTNANTAGAELRFTGATNATMSGTGGANLRLLTLNKGTNNTAVLEITSAFRVRSAVSNDTFGFLNSATFNGTLKISGSATYSSNVFQTTGYSIPATGGLWLNNPNFTVNGLAGSPTVSGLLRLSQGTYNVGTASGNSLGGATGASFVIEGGTLNITGRLNTASVVVYTQTGGTVNVSTIGNTSATTASFGLTSGTSTFNMSGGTINLVQANSNTTLTSRLDYSVLGTANVTGGTLNIGTAATATIFDFRIRGQVPNLVLTNTTNPKNVFLSAQTNVFGNTLINSGTTLNLNGFLLIQFGPSITNNGTLTGTTASSTLYFAGSAAQTYAGNGTITAGLAVLSVDNLAGVTIDPAVSQIVTLRVNLFSGTLVNSNKISLGNGGTTSGVVQTGATGLTSPGGNFDVAPVFNLGTGGQIMIYSGETVPRTSGNEINPSRVLTSLTIANANGVTLAGGDLALANTAVALTLTSGNLSTGSNTLTISSPTGTVSRTSGHVIGNFKKTFAAAGSKTFEVGTSSAYSPVTVNATAGTFPADLTAKAVSGPQPQIARPGLSLQRYWTLTAPNVTTADLTFTYVVADVPGTATEANFVLINANGGAPVNAGGSVNTTTHVASILGATSMGDWTAGEPNALVPLPTNTPTNTPVTPTATDTATNTPVTPTATNTATNTPVTPTATSTTTNTPVTPTATNTATNTPVTPTATNTATNTPVTPTATNTATNTPVTPTATNTATNTPVTPTATNTATNTPVTPTTTNTATNTPVTPTTTNTATNTPVTPTATNTATNTPVTPTATNTATNTPVTPTTTNTATNTPVTPTTTNTATNTPVTPTATNTATNTPVTPTATNTATNTPVTPTATNTATNTPVTPTATNTATNTPVTPTATNTATNTPVTPTATNTATNTPVTPTATNTATTAPTATSTATTAPTATSTATTAPTATTTPTQLSGGDNNVLWNQLYHAATAANPLQELVPGRPYTFLQPSGGSTINATTSVQISMLADNLDLSGAQLPHLGRHAGERCADDPGWHDHRCLPQPAQPHVCDLAGHRTCVCRRHDDLLPADCHRWRKQRLPQVH